VAREPKKKPKDDDVEITRNATVATTEDLVMIAEKTMRGDIRETILQHWQANHNVLPWRSRGEAEQERTIQAADVLASTVVRSAVMIVAGQGRRSAQGRLKKIAVGEDLKLLIEIPRSNDMRHDLMDATGAIVAISLMDMASYMGERAKTKADPDQKPLFDDGPDVPSLGGEDDEGGGLLDPPD
jgi:hypothetical protein